MSVSICTFPVLTLSSIQTQVRITGTIAELQPANDYGRIKTPDGRLIYFHRNSLLEADLESLMIGAEVRFEEHSGDEGPQASSVRLIGKHHIY